MNIHIHPNDAAKEAPSWTAPELGESIKRRMLKLDELSRCPDAQVIELERCRRDILHWFYWWPWTYNPNLVEIGIPSRIPLELFPRQVDMVKWIMDRVAEREDGLLEKSRDIGFTWVAGSLAWWCWRWRPGFKTTFGSRQLALVDRIGDPDSIFEKIRMMMRALPRWMWPPGFASYLHDKSNLLLNPENGNTIRGEGGEEMGRGGRSSLYIIDEGAFIERDERVDAATSANSETRIWASSVNGMENVFARKRFGGQLLPQQIFRFHWTDDPRKTPEWATKKKRTMEPFMWASEYEIDYAASTEGTCIPAAWVESAKKLAALTRVVPAPEGVVGGDVGAGKAKSVVVARFGPVVRTPVYWSDPDTIDTAHKMLDFAVAQRFVRDDNYDCRVKSLRYDNIGVGVGVTAALKRSPRTGLIVVGVNVGDPPTENRWPDGEKSIDKFSSLKAEAWWTMRERFKRTHEHVLHLEGKEGGHAHNVNDLISLPVDSEGFAATQLGTELSLPRWGRTENGKIQLETKKSLISRGAASPDFADALALTFTGYSKAEKWAKFGREAVF